MGVTDFFAGEIATELLKMLLTISRKSLLCKASADSLAQHINSLIPIIDEIKRTGVELPHFRQSQLDRLSETLRDGIELSKKVLASNRWNAYKNLQLARKMEKLEKNISRFVNGPMQAHILADVHHLRFDTDERFDRLEGAAMRLEQRLGAMKIGSGMTGGWMEEAVKHAEVEEERWEENLVNILGVGMEVGQRKVKEMVIEGENLGVVGICGLGGSGKTTLVKKICQDEQVRSYFRNRILFLTVSQSPNVEQLKAKIWRFITGSDDTDGVVTGPMPSWNLPKFEWRFGARMLIVLDDVWSPPVLDELICKIPGCKTLVVSRFKFPVVNACYEMELLRGNDAISLFCLSAFGQKSIPLAADAKLIKQIVNECKGLPLALKVIGSALRGQPELYWASAKKRLLRGEPIDESHENKLLERMGLSVNFLPKKVQECFLDLGCFPEDKKIPLDVLVNMWVETHDIDAEEAFAILVELSNKNLLTLVKDARAGDLYSSYYDISVTQHDVLRDLAIHLANRGHVNERRRLLMPRRDTEIPKEWDRNADQPFNAEIVSVHTDEMKEMDWLRMDFPKAKVLIINFSGNEYFLPPFIDDMPKLRALIVINHSTRNATLHNLSDFSNMVNLRSLWLEKVSIFQFMESSMGLKNLRKMSLILCKINNSLDRVEVFQSLSELTIDHCDDLIRLPPSISRLQSLKNLSLTNCHNLQELPSNLDNLRNLQILRFYACPTLKMLPSSICELASLKYLDISQCINLKSLPEQIGKLSRLEKIDMRECSQIWDLPDSVELLESLRLVISDEEVSWSWKQMRKDNVHVQVAEKHFSLDWLDE